MRACHSLRGLIAEQDYEVIGSWFDPTNGDQFYQTMIGERVVLYHVSHFYPDIFVDPDEF